MSSSSSIKSYQEVSSSVYAYHMLRCAVDKYHKSVQDLNQKQYEDVSRKAEKAHKLESMVLSTDEARRVVIPEYDVNAAIKEVAGRYESEEDFVRDMERNNLDKEILRQALHRELVFNAVMGKVASQSATTSDLDVRVFYELHRDRFSVPESRAASHILVTINSEYHENSRDAAFARINKIAVKVQNNPNRFPSQAKKYSECPTALEGGTLGVVQRGVLFPEIDQVLFEMEEGKVSDIIETELGFHLVYCTKIHKAKAQPLSMIYERIQAMLDERKRRSCQKAWIKKITEGSVV